MFANPQHEELLELQIDRILVAQLDRPAVLQCRLLQSDLLDTLSLILNSKVAIRRAREARVELSSDEDLSRTLAKTNNVPSLTLNSTLLKPRATTNELLNPPNGLLSCLLKGVENLSSQDVIQKWIQIVCASIAFYRPSSFHVLMKVVDCFCREIERCSAGMRAQYEKESPIERNFESPLLHLLNGLDFILARAHEQLLTEEDGLVISSSAESQQGFFGNMVSGALSSDAKQVRSKTNNNRLTVILCFQDALKSCFRLWSWQSVNKVCSADTIASFQHASQKIRSRSRRILEHLLAAEPLEGVEALASMWVKAIMERDFEQTESLLNLVYTLNGSRPAVAVAAIFSAINSRTNPMALQLSQKSTLSSDLGESDIVAFEHICPISRRGCSGRNMGRLYSLPSRCPRQSAATSTNFDPTTRIYRHLERKDRKDQFWRRAKDAEGSCRHIHSCSDGHLHDQAVQFFSREAERGDCS